MRLLVRGGNSYTERRRIGAWVEVASGALEDLYGLSAETPVFGLGLNDGQPFLVVRRLHKTEGTRIYPYALLLDPGREVLARFGWNVAAFAEVMLASSDSLVNRIFERPEEIDETEIVAALDALKRDSIEKDATRVKLRELWAGAPCVEPIVEAPSQETGFAERPSPAQIAAVLDTLPDDCFRCGLGWLVGGSRGHAQAFGAKLLLDADLSTEDATLDNCREEGARLLTAWETIKQHPDFKSEIEKRSQTPLWEWEREHGSSLAEFAPRLVLLAKLLGEWPMIDDATLAQLEETLAREGPLVDDLRRAAFDSLRAASKRLRETDEKLNPAATRLLVGEHLAKRINAADLVESLEPDTLIKYFVEHGHKPDETCRLNLSQDTMLAIWRERARDAQTSDDAVKELSDALRSLGYTLASSNKDALDGLISEVFDARAPGAPLDLWDYFEGRIEGVRVAEKLRDEARARIETRSHRDKWEIEYLMYAQDEGGAYLSDLAPQLALSRTELDTLVKKFIRIANGSDAAAEKARPWLKRLHESSLRSKLSLDTKLSLVEYSQKEWSDLAYLWQLYDFKEGDGQIEKPKDVKNFSELIPFLREELGELATERKPPGVPRLKDIVDLLVQIDSLTKQKLRALRPALNGTTIKRWYAGWKALDEHDFALDEVIRFIKESKATPDKFSFDDYEFSDARIAKLIEDLLYGDSQERDQRYASILKQLLEQTRRDTRLTAAVARGVRDLVGDDFSVGVFARRFIFEAIEGERKLLNLIFECLTETDADELMHRIAQLNPEQFAKVASGLYYGIERAFFEGGRDQGGVSVRQPKVIKENGLMKPYMFALIRFMQSPEGHAAKRSVADQLSSFFDKYEMVHKRFVALNEYIRLKVGNEKSRPPATGPVGKSNGRSESTREPESDQMASPIDDNDQSDSQPPHASSEPIVIAEVKSPNVVTRKLGSLKRWAKDWLKQQNDTTPAALSAQTQTATSEESDGKISASGDDAQKNETDEGARDSNAGAV
ncbi:MAG: hypothetical protein QOE33_144 [Acidobacteriota bacterium]|nr:hypothetical protein [Acidobacteriota bacterium]